MLNFQAVPVARVDSHLPAVPLAQLQPLALRQRFATPPDWAPEIRREPAWVDRRPAAAAVLMPVLLRASPTVLLTRRAAHLPTHAGQVAFPGGKVDANDASPTHAALREAHEEVGLVPESVEVLGALPLYATGSGFVVTPVLGLVRPPVVLAPNPGEVEEAFEVPLAYLMNPAHHRQHDYAVDGQTRTWFSMPYWDGQREHYIWGATAGMLRNLYRLLIA